MIQVSHLSKFYGDFPAVRDLSFEIGDGAVYGFLGPNGAGKSTTMNMITGCLSPTEGTVKIGGNLAVSERHVEWYAPLPASSLRECTSMSGTVSKSLSFVGAMKIARNPTVSQVPR